MSNSIFKGLKVVELGTHVAIPYLTRTLADMGADVIKIEPPKGESYRHIGKMFHMPFTEGNNVMYTPYNLNKKSISLNLKNEESKEVLYKLLADADVFATNTRINALEGLGIGIDTLKQKFPKLIITHLNGFGEKGAEKDRPGYDSAAFWCRSGAVGEWSFVEDRPIKPFYGFGDAIASYQLVIGTLSALYNRRETGKGDVVHVSLFAAGLFTNVAGVMRGQPDYGHTFPKTRYQPILPVDNFFKTKDGKWILISEERWEQRCDAYFDIMNTPELKGNPDYCTLAGAFKRLDEFTRLFEEKFADIDSKDLAAMLDRIDTVYEFVTYPEELYKDKQAWDNDFLCEVQTPDGSKIVIPTNPVRYDSQGLPDVGQAPMLGQHSVEILKELGYNDQQIADMIANKSIVAK